MMENEKLNAAGDGDSELSFEALTFGDANGDDRNGRQLAKKKDKFRKKPSKKEPFHTPEGDREKSSSIYISTQDEKIDVQALLRKLEQFGVVRGYYFKEKQNFGIVQFVEPSVVDAVLEHFDSGELGFHVTVERTSRTKEAYASPHSFGSIPATPASVPNTPTIPSTPPPPEKPDTILVLKNLPFTLKQDQLHEILLSLSTTIPQSISLHYDTAGVFRGMAFIKYRQLEDAIQVYELLNGMDVGGRKVRVEYKRKPAGNGKIEIPAEWQEDDELRRLWEQLNDFKSDPNQMEWYYPSNLTNMQKRNIYNMTDKLKLVQCSSGDNEVRVLYLRKTPISTSHNNSINNNHSGYGQLLPPRPEHNNNNNNTYAGMEASKSGRAIEIKGRRPRHDSETVPVRPGASSPRGDGSRSSVGRNEGAKTIASSAPADMNLDWRGNQPSQAHSFGNHNQFTHINSAQQPSQQQQQQQLIAPMRQPKGPDGSKGFGTSRKPPARPTASLLGTTEVSV